MKRILCTLLALLIFLEVPSVAYAKKADKEVNAKAVVLMAMDNKQVLYQENQYEHLSPASVTKIMSLLLALEALDNKKISLKDKVTASSTATSMGGSQIWLEVGETMTVEELLKAVIVASANDACTALGEHIAGSSVGFVKMMNEKSKQLGLKNTNFENCTGLDDTTTNHYSCAYDLAVIASEVMKYEDIVTKYSTIWLDSLRNGKTELNNTNKLINKYNGITGLKTGTTSNAGFCIAATANRDGLRLVAVVLGSDTSEHRFSTASYLLDYGFANYEAITPKIDKEKITYVKINHGVEKSIKPTVDKLDKIVVSKGNNEIKYKYNILKSINAPVNKGQSLGNVEILNGHKTIQNINVYADKNIEKVNYLFIFNQLLKNL